VPTGALVASDYDKYCCSNRDHGGGTLYILCSYVKLSIGESTTRIVILNDKRSACHSKVWTDLRHTSADKERFGYPTQKLEALLERIVKTSEQQRREPCP
jgi:hypothetical protein